ncbi:protocadherin-9 isoform X1 [Tachysurus ichikawai]
MKKSQRRVTFHLPDGSQESCSDSGLGEPESVGGGALLSKPLPLAQEEFYEQDKRTEADGNSDPNSDGLLGPRGLMEATEMCTQECLVLGHSDNCWMPPKSPAQSYGGSQNEWTKDKLLNGHTLNRGWKSSHEHFGDRKSFAVGGVSSHMTDIPLASLKSYQASSGSENPKEQQL